MMRGPLLTGFVAGFLIAVLALVVLREPSAPPEKGPEQVATARAALSCTAEQGAQQASLDINAADIRLPTYFQDRLATGADILHNTWQAWLGDDTLLPAPVRVRFVADLAQFADLYKGPVPSGADTSGFYRMRDNEAVILYSPYRRQDTLATTLHEVAHLFTAWHLGSTPAWLNEGIAEHFETLNRRGEFSRSAEHIVVLRRDGPTPLPDLLTLRRSEFAKTEARRHYASAWALIAFLLEADPGPIVFEGLLRSAHAERCNVYRDHDLALDAYPGGLTQLAADWDAWVAEL